MGAILSNMAAILSNKIAFETKSLDDKERKKLGGTYVRLTDGMTHYRLSGPTNTGKRVVFVHGATFALWVFDEQLQVFHDAGYQVLAYDKFGKGYSDRPRVASTNDLYVKQLRELTLKLEFDKFDIFGGCLSGGTVIKFVAQYPDSVKKLILYAPMITKLNITPLIKIPILAEIGIRFKTRNMYSPSLFVGSKTGNDYVTLFQEQLQYKGFHRSFLSMLRNDAFNGDYTDSYKIVAKQEGRKIMIVWGSGDTTITRPMINKVVSLLPNAEFHVVDNVNHIFLINSPDKINFTIEDFLKRN